MKIFLKKFNKEKLKEISLVVFAFVLVGIGYVNFANNDNINLKSYAKSTNSLGDVELVNSNAIDEVEIVENESQNAIVENDVQENIIEKIEEDSFNSENYNILENDKSNYFSEAKLNRDIMYDEILETYQKMVDSNTISNEQKSIAVKEIEKISKQKISISIAEELIKFKGFEDVIILISDVNVNVVVRIAVLSREQVVQIQNIVTKELGVDIQNISISTK